MSIEIPKECPSTEEIVAIVNKFQKNNKLSEVELLGEGSYGKVLRYKDSVIKMMDIPSPEHRQLFDSETLILEELAKIKELSEYIPKYCWTGISDKGTLGVIVQMYEPVITLHELLNRPGLFPADAASEFMLNLIEGFQILHHAGYVHRDIKPENILVRKGGPKKYIPIIIDFGFACPKPCEDFERKGTPGFVPMNWMSNRESREKSRGFRRENMFLISRSNQKNGPQTRKTYNLSFEHSIPSDVNIRKRIKTQPYRLTPHYTDFSDNYALFLTLKYMFVKVDWSGHEKEREEMIDRIQKLRDQEVFELAAQAARDESKEKKTQRLEALKRLNSQREARMENRARENAEAELLASFAEAPRRNGTGTRKRARANNSNRPGPRSRQRQEGAPHA